MITFPENWIEYEFGAFAEFNSKISLTKGSHYPFVPMENLNANLKYVTAFETKEYSGGGSKFCNGDTLFARITPCLENGKIAQVQNLPGDKGFGSTEYFVFRGRRNISDTNFIYYLSKTDWFQQNAINSMVGASGRQRADAKFVSKTPLILPPLPTQKKIAATLSAYDDLIENNLKRIKLLEEMAQITYKEWFVRLKFPGYETTPMDSGTGLPEGWCFGKVLDLFGLQRGFDLPIQERENGAIPIIASTGVTGFHSSYKVNGPGVVTGRSGTIGQVMFIDSDFWPLNTTLWVKKFKSCGPIFVKHFLQNFNLESLCGGSAVPSLDRKAVHVQRIVIPTAEIMKSYEIYASSLYEATKVLRSQNELLKEARDILLPRLMTGMIDVERLVLPEPFSNTPSSPAQEPQAA